MGKLSASEERFLAGERVPAEDLYLIHGSGRLHDARPRKIFEIAQEVSNYKAMCDEEKSAIKKGAALAQRCNIPAIYLLDKVVPAGSLAAYYPKKDVIVLSPDALRSEYKDETLLHELTHALQERAPRFALSSPQGKKYPQTTVYQAEVEAYGAEKAYDAKVGKKFEFDESELEQVLKPYREATIKELKESATVQTLRWGDLKKVQATKPGVLSKPKHKGVLSKH